MFKLLRRYKIVGASVTPNQVSAIPIYTDRLPIMFERLLEGINCINYSTADCDDILDDSCPGNMLSQSNMNNDSSEESVEEVTIMNNEPRLDFGLEDKFCSIINSEKVTYVDPRSNPYAFLKMSFSEMTDVMKYHASNEEILQVKSYLDKTTTMMMKRAGNRDPNAIDDAIVSSNTNYKKNRKSHGTKY